MRKKMYLPIQVFSLLICLCLSGLNSKNLDDSESNQTMPMNKEMLQMMKEQCKSQKVQMENIMKQAKSNIEDLLSSITNSSGIESLMQGQMNTSGIESLMQGQMNTSGIESLMQGQMNTSGIESQMHEYMDKSGIESQMHEYMNTSGIESQMQNHMNISVDMESEMQEHMNTMQNEYNKICGQVENFKMSSLTAEQAISWVMSAKEDPKDMYEVLRSLGRDALKGILKTADEQHWKMSPELAPVVNAIGEQYMKSMGGSRRLSLTSFKEMGKSAIFMIPVKAIKTMSDSVFEYYLEQVATASQEVVEMMDKILGGPGGPSGSDCPPDQECVYHQGPTSDGGSMDSTGQPMDPSNYDQQGSMNSSGQPIDPSNYDQQGSMNSSGLPIDPSNYDQQGSMNSTGQQYYDQQGSSGPQTAIKPSKASVTSALILPKQHGYKCKGAEPDWMMVPMFMLRSGEHARLKAICQRLFHKYKTPARLNSARGWDRVKHFMFCAPTPVCQKIQPQLIKTDIKYISNMLPWGCGKVKEVEMEKGNDGELSHGEMMQMVTSIFPSNKPCGMTLISKLFGGKQADLYPINSADDLKSLGYFCLCIPDKRIKTALDKIGCDLGKEILDFGLFSNWVNRYTARKCLQLPETFDDVTCDTLQQQYGNFLSTMKMKFFKQLDQTVLCNKSCIHTFKNSGVSPNMMDFVVGKCYGKEAVITAEVVANLGAMVTDLPMEKFDEISAADLESNLDSIKTDLKKSKGRGRSKKRAVMGKLAKKMIGDGKISAIVDSKEIMKQVSLKELKSSLSSSSDLLTDLGVNATSDIAMTDSQKKWVVKKLLKQKSSDSMTLEDITRMSGLVTGLLSSDIKNIGLSNKTDVELMEFAKVMCSYNNWPTKSLKAINKRLIHKALEYRNSTNHMASLTSMDVEGIGCECFMHFSASDFKAMESDVCSGVCQKIGHCSNFRCLNPRRRKNTLQACLKCKGLGANPMTETDIDELGPSLISQMSKTQLDLIPTTVLAGHLQFFKEMCMSKILRDAVSDALPRVLGSHGSDYSSDVLYLLGGAIKLLPSSIQQDLDLSVLAEMSTSILEEIIPREEDAIKLRKCCEQWLSAEDLADLSQVDFNLMLTLKQAMFARAETESSRRKRSTSLWTCSFIQQSPALFSNTATENEITGMVDAEFVECLTDIGQLTDYNTTQKDALLAKAKTALNEANVCNMQVTDVVSQGSILTSLSTDEINCLPLNDTSLMTSIGSTTGWSTSQLEAIATRYVSSNSLADLSALIDSDIAMLGPVLCGFTANQIATIPSVEIGKSGTVVGALLCDVAILSEFAKLAVMVDAFGPVDQWGAAEVSELNYLIAGLTGTEIKDLTVGALEGLDASVIPVIPVSVFKEMSTTQFEAFTDAQATAVTESQLAEMNEETTTLLDSQSTGGLEEVPEVKMTDSANAVYSMIHIVMTLFAAMVLTSVI